MAALASRFVLPYQTVIDASGVPIPGAFLYFYQSGTNNPLNTYSNAALTIPNSNPVQAASNGQFPAIFMQAQAYKVVLTDALGDEIWTADPVIGTGGASATTNLRTVTGNTTVLATDKILEVDGTLGDVIVTFPLALGNTQQTQTVKIVKIDDTTSEISIVDDGSATSRYTLLVPANGAQMQSVEAYSNGAALRILV